MVDVIKKHKEEMKQHIDQEANLASEMKRMIDEYESIEGLENAKMDGVFKKEIRVAQRGKDDILETRYRSVNELLGMSYYSNANLDLQVVDEKLVDLKKRVQMQ